MSTTTAAPADRRGDQTSAGLLIRMSIEQREQVHAIARADGVSARVYLLGLIEEDLRRRQARAAAREKVQGL